MCARPRADSALGEFRLLRCAVGRRLAAPSCRPGSAPRVGGHDASVFCPEGPLPLGVSVRRPPPSRNTVTVPRSLAVHLVRAGAFLKRWPAAGQGRLVHVDDRLQHHRVEGLAHHRASSRGGALCFAVGAVVHRPWRRPSGCRLRREDGYGCCGRARALGLLVDPHARHAGRGAWRCRCRRRPSEGLLVWKRSAAKKRLAGEGLLLDAEGRVPSGSSLTWVGV
mmetsp:Transcript_47524/g.133767  ORF Transcript_47524/g.133767 Transcript_47524/m.133767 type:complete len:223 (-) Transcript_47524:250-918(-)